MKTKAVGWLSMALLATVAAYSAVAAPAFRILETPANDAVALDINNRGLVVGRAFEFTGQFWQQTGFLLVDRLYVRINPVLPPDDATVHGIDDKGAVVGHSSNFGVAQSFKYSNGVFTNIAPPSWLAYWIAEKTNTRGDVVGRYVDDSPVGYFAERGLLFSKGTFAKIDFPTNGPVLTTVPMDINERGAIVGRWIDTSPAGENVHHGFIRSPSGRYTRFDVPGSLGMFPSGINNLGHVVGTYTDASRVEHGFLLIAGRYTRIDIPGSLVTYVNGINDSDEIVGWYSDGQSAHTFIANAQSFRP